MKRPYTPGPRLYARFTRVVKARGLEIQAVADTLGVSRSHLFRVLTDPERHCSPDLWARLTPYLKRSA